MLIGTHKTTIIGYFIIPTTGTGVVNVINILETKNNLGYIQRISLYRAVNTLRPCCKNRLNDEDFQLFEEPLGKFQDRISKQSTTASFHILSN